MLELHEYQKTGAKWLASKANGLLADEMGLGKSAQALTACDLVGAQKIVIVCRAVARRNWKNEIRKFSSNRSPVFVVGDTILPSPDAEAFFIITSFEGIDRVLSWLRHRRINSNYALDAVIVDESHFAKSSLAKRTGDVFGVQGIIRFTLRMWCLTGTPTPNNASELWVMFFVFGVTKLTYLEFVDKFCTIRKTGFGDQITGTKKEMRKEFQALFDQCAIQRTIADSGLELPPLRIDEVVVSPGRVDIEAAFPDRDSDEVKASLKKTYQEMVLAVTNGEFIDDMMLEILKATTPAISTLRRYIGLQTFEPVCSMIRDELESDKSLKIVVFCVHVHLLRQFANTFRDFGAVLVCGSEPDTGQVEKFQTSPSTRLFFGQITAAGTSITLTAAHEVLIVEPSWVPADNAQAIARCLRIGQKYPVRARFVKLDDPVAYQISDLIQRKTESVKHLYEREIE